MTQKIIMFHSYKGGSGKTLLSLNMADQLARNGSKVILIEMDLDAPVLARNLPDLPPHSGYINQFLKAPVNLSRLITEYKNFDVILASPQFSQENLLKARDYENLVRLIPKIKQELNSIDYDYIIFDLSPGVNYLAIATVLLCDTVFVILRPDKNSFEGTKILIEEIYSNVVSHHQLQFHLIVNQLPNHPEFEQLLMEWNILFKHHFPFILTNNSIPFHPLTSLNTLKHGMLLPNDDPLVSELQKIFQEAL